MNKYNLVAMLALVGLPVLAVANADKKPIVVTATHAVKHEILDTSRDIYIAGEVPAGMTVQEKKERFFSLVVPVVNEMHQELDRQFQEVSSLIETGRDNNKIDELKQKYGVASDEALLMALKPHPKSIVLAQAAMESAWATSRFFTEAKNIFGVWSFDKDEPRIAAGEKRGEQTIWLKQYPSLKASVRDYYRVLAKGDAFENFRALRLTSNDPHKLVKLLDAYSEKGNEYGKALTSMIKTNGLKQYDQISRL